MDAAPTSGAGAPEPFPWEPVEVVHAELSAALAGANWAGLEARLRSLASVMRYPSGSDLEELSAGQLVSWLQSRWQPGIVVEIPRFVPHFPSLEAQTSGWRPVPPSGTTMHFMFHVNPDTRIWFLDVLQYE